jgi:pseudomonalisin
MNLSTLRHSPLPALALTTTLAFAVAVGMSAQAGSITNGMGPAVASATALSPGDVFTGVLPHTQPMHIVVALKLRNSDQLNGLIAAHQTLTPAQLSADYEPTLAQAQAVATYLTQLGFTHLVIAPNRMLVSADGNADNAQAAFQTSFGRVQTHDGRAAFANTSDAHVPSSLQGSVLSVLGLQNVYVAHSFAQRALADAASVPLTGHNPLDFSPIYSATGVPTAAGVTVGIVTEGDLTQALVDLGLFTTANNLAPVTTQAIYVEPDSGDTSSTDEWDIDSQDIVGAAGGQVGQLIFYATPSFSFADLNIAFNAAVVANQAKVIDVSIGGCETSAKNSGAAAASDQIFQLAVAQGQTFSISTGDDGADECGTGGLIPEWPASSPYVVAAAGTHLSSSATAWLGEVVWNDLPNHGATGGSPSTFEPKPSWQDALVPGTMRGVADIAFEADPFTGSLIYVNGGIQLWGGTSLASPIFVGLWARVIAVKGTGVGFAAPLLYQLPATDFHDIISGNNGGETAGVGYDFATGRGSVILSSAINHIGVTNPLVANFSETASGLIAKFNDSSTDSGGTITAHAWTFGDGGTATLANPSHIYLKAGTYSVTETVTGQAGWAATQSASVTIK